ncbi:hypothetical protein ESCO_003469 [Escovopsis weberi]|uniref:Glutaminase A n=1 Tax=Escovopsis weberi TaxID=150374 RepID=A0A0M8N9Q5_ESCWE|nr:hypothetical protein ESCO_003469 [Escovopsis weberi]
MGNAPGPGNVDQISLDYTSTKSVFTFSVAGKVQLTAEFLSPVFPDDYKRQSIPFSYLKVSASPLDGKAHSVQVYVDVSAEWASGDGNAIVQWETSSVDGVRSHKFFRQIQDEFNEANDEASWGSWYWSTGDSQGMTYQIGQDIVVRGQFLSNGKLPNTVDPNFRSVSNQWPVFAFARDFGSVGQGDSASVLLTIGVAQDNAIQFQGAGDTPQSIPSYWKQYYSEQELVNFFYDDYSYAAEYSAKLDSKVSQDSMNAGGNDYVTATSLSLRQAFGGLQIVGTEANPLVFLKEISSDSDIQTVDVLFPTMPVLLYLAPNMIKESLIPLLINQESGHYPNKYAIHDLGRYPRALGYPAGNDEPMPLEECGNMIIMMLAYAQKTGDVEFLRDYYNLTAGWAQFLIDEAKIPAEQLSTDDFAGHLANQTNLAIKGIIALEAMGQIAKLTGTTPAQNYSAIAQDYLEFWNIHGINHAASPPHTELQYDNGDSFGLLYNIYPDKLLKLGLLPQSLYDQQSDFYFSKQSTYGVILDTRSTQTKLDWEFWVAATSKPDTKSMLISKIARWINTTTTWRALTDLYDATTGGYPGNQFTARPVVGGVFALLAL